MSHGDKLASGYIAQWLERLTADQQVPGSNPGVPFARWQCGSLSGSPSDFSCLCHAHKTVARARASCKGAGGDAERRARSGCFVHFPRVDT
jgi:hypothetical protein